jgi:hypothetical protein
MKYPFRAEIHRHRHNWWERLRNNWFGRETLVLGSEFTVEFKLGLRSVTVQGYTATDGTRTLTLNANGGARFKLVEEP